MSKIYTKSGDQGQTSLASGKRLSKHDTLIEAYGTVDELNSFVGDLMATCSIASINEELSAVQYILFNIGSELARDGVVNDNYPEMKASDVNSLELWIDHYTESLEPMTAFILPSGSPTISKAHLCRTVCRRAERRVLAVDRDVDSRDLILMYLNRLSDYFFTLARYFAHIEGVKENLWNAK
ncbi:MAG: cob(I)yrinic acid a,c-diamide adenosyltransferase [Bacteroidota bacterium]